MIYRLIVLVLILSATAAGAQEYVWKFLPVDGSRTGCKASVAGDVVESLGRVAADGTYVTPSGRTFKASASAAKVAALVMGAQQHVASVKQVIAHSVEEMPNERYENTLSKWFTGVLKEEVEAMSGRKVDVVIANFGGIRIGMPQGDVILDDILSMFPFRNNLVYLELRGSHLRNIFQEMASTRFQAVGGVHILVEDGRLVKVEIDGESLADEKVYGVATISFLLHGGDGLHLADNASDIQEYDVLIKDAVVAYLTRLTADGKSIIGPDVNYVTIRR